MAGVLRSCGSWNVDSVISFLIVASGQLCDRVYEVVQKATRNRAYRIIAHKCESVANIVRVRPDLHVDFVVFAFDGRINHLINENPEGLESLGERILNLAEALMGLNNGIPDLNMLNLL